MLPDYVAPFIYYPNDGFILYECAVLWPLWVQSIFPTHQHFRVCIQSQQNRKKKNNEIQINYNKIDVALSFCIYCKNVIEIRTNAPTKAEKKIHNAKCWAIQFEECAHEVTREKWHANAFAEAGRLLPSFGEWTHNSIYSAASKSNECEWPY